MLRGTINSQPDEPVGYLSLPKGSIIHPGWPRFGACRPILPALSYPVHVVSL